MNIKIIILRPTQGAEQSAKIALDRGFDPVIASASQIQPISWQSRSPASFDAIMITSANALRHAGHNLHDYLHLPLFAVGKATAQLARDMGFTIAAIGQGGAKALLPLITAYGARNILRLVGRDYVDVQADNCNFETILVYEAAALPLSNALKNIICDGEAPHIFTFHSTRAVQIFSAYIETLWAQGMTFNPADHYALTLAPTITKALKQYDIRWKEVITSPSANDEEMMAILGERISANKQ